jgi:hypothetical protein
MNTTSGIRHSMWVTVWYGGLGETPKFWHPFDLATAL